MSPDMEGVSWNRKAPFNSLIQILYTIVFMVIHEETIAMPPHWTVSLLVRRQFRVYNRPATSIGYADEMKNAFWLHWANGVGFGI